MGAMEDFNNNNKDDDEYNFDDDDGDEVPLPGFRFHPTDEELVGFYLRRKLDKKPISLELIKQIDIYKYDPWDLPKASSTGGEKEWYFFCQRGRKYRNSIRPNRVTGSGFWKATGIDKSVYSVEGKCIGLKKTLVYYRGSAGKGTKTDWMMHEFRLPSSTSNNNNNNNDTNTNLANAKNNKDIAQEAEVWTLCRIIKRDVSQKRYTQECRSQLATKRQYSTEKITTRMSTVDEHCNTNNGSEAYINFGTSLGHYHDHNDQKPVINYYTSDIDQRHHQFYVDHHQLSSQVAQQPQLTAPSSNFWINPASNDFFAFDNCDELGSVVKFAVDSPIM